MLLPQISQLISLTAATITKGYREQNAGFWIAIGHAVVEIPLIAIIYFGFTSFLISPEIKKIIGLAGGLMLIFMGSMMFRSMGKDLGEVDLPYNSLTAGIVMTGANPYFILWWATVGVVLITSAIEFGIIGFIIFIIVHWTCDLVWEQIISMTVFKTKRFWTLKIQKVIFLICALVLIGFGIWFCLTMFI
ncbi:LysE family transporter [Chloroflexota bacterium]